MNSDLKPRLEKLRELVGNERQSELASFKTVPMHVQISTPPGSGLVELATELTKDLHREKLVTPLLDRFVADPQSVEWKDLLEEIGDLLATVA